MSNRPLVSAGYYGRPCISHHSVSKVMAVFWIMELLPLPITSLLPLVVLPLTGVASTDEVARLYLKVSNK